MKNLIFIVVMGQVSLEVPLNSDKWYTLLVRNGHHDHVEGDIRISLH